MPDTVQAVDKVDFQNPEYKEMAPAWELTDALRAHTAAMKKGGQKWLPKEEAEPPDRYNVRRERSVLFGAYRKAVDNLAGRPFAKDVILKGKALPEQLAGVKDRVDNEGRNLTQFCRRGMEIGIDRGLVHILVDYPQEPATTKLEERERKLQPLFSLIDPKALIGWRWEIAANGEKVLTQIRIAETAEENSGAYGVVIKSRIRVIERVPGGTEYHWQLFEKREKDEWLLIKEGPWTVGKITLVTVYFAPTGFMTGEPTLMDLADMNLAHYQTLSDHRNFLRFAMTGLVATFGFAKEEAQKIVWGLNNVASTESPDGRIEAKEFTGAAAAAGDKHLDRLEVYMEALAMQPLIIKRWGNETAMGRAIDEGKGQCDLQSWIRIFEAGMKQAYVYAGEWVGVKQLPEDFGVDIYDDVGLSLRNAADKDWLLRVCQAGKIDDETFLEEGKLIGGFSDTFDVKRTMGRLRAQGPAPGMVGREEEEGEEE